MNVEQSLEVMSPLKQFIDACAAFRKEFGYHPRAAHMHRDTYEKIMREVGFVLVDQRQGEGVFINGVRVEIVG